MSINIKIHMNVALLIFESLMVTPFPMAPYVSDLKKMNMSFSKFSEAEPKIITIGKFIIVKSNESLIISLSEQRYIDAPIFNSLARSVIGGGFIHYRANFPLS